MSVVDPLIAFSTEHGPAAHSVRRRALRFGGGLAVLAMLLGTALALWGKDRLLGAAIAGGGLLALALAALFPAAALRVRAAWMWLARLIGRINTAFLLSILYLVFVVPWGMIVRIRGRSALAKPRGASYFHARSAPAGREEFERPY